MIGFDVFASVSFAISGSLALYMVLQFIEFLIITFKNIAENDTFRPARR